MRKTALILILSVAASPCLAAIDLRYSTASQEVPVGFFLDSTDGNTEETGLTISNTDVWIWKAGATRTYHAAAGLTHMNNGLYYAVLDANDTNTKGPLVIFVHESGSLAERVNCRVLDPNEYDRMYSTGEVDVYSAAGQKVTAAWSTFDPNATPVQVSTTGVAAIAGGLNDFDPNATPVQVSSTGVAAVQSGLSTFDPNTTPVQVSSTGVAAVAAGIDGSGFSALPAVTLANGAHGGEGASITLSDYSDFKATGFSTLTVADVNTALDTKLPADFNTVSVTGGNIHSHLKAADDNVSVDPNTTDITGVLTAYGASTLTVADVNTALGTKLPADFNTVSVTSSNLHAHLKAADDNAIVDVNATDVVAALTSYGASTLAVADVNTALGTKLPADFNTVTVASNAVLSTLANGAHGGAGASITLADYSDFQGAGALTVADINDSLDAKLPVDFNTVSVTGGNLHAHLKAADDNVIVDVNQADFFADSGTTYAAASAGSVVKETADNAGGASLTVDDIYDRLLPIVPTDFNGVGITSNNLHVHLKAADDNVILDVNTTDVQAGMTAQGYTDTRGAYLDELAAANIPADVDTIAGIVADANDQADAIYALAAGASGFAATKAVVDDANDAIQDVNDAIDPNGLMMVVIHDVSAEAGVGTVAEVWTAGTRTLTALDEDSTTIDLNGSTIGTVTTLTTWDKTGYSIADATSDAVIADAVWNAATGSYGGAGSYGLLLETDLDAAISSRSTLTAANVWETNISAYAGVGYAGTYLKTNYDAIANGTYGLSALESLVDDIGVAGAGLTAVPWNSAWDTEVESEVDDALGAGTGTALTAIPWNAAWDAEVQSEATDALTAYDPPTHAEVTTAVANVSVDEIQATALADLFNTDSGTTYGAAVAGSVVSEIADNAGGSALTESGIADAVWNELSTGHTDAGKAGAQLWTDIDAILTDTAAYDTDAEYAAAIWNALIATYSGTVGSTAEQLAAAGAAGDPWSTALPGAYAAGTAGYIVGTNLNAPVATVDTVVDAIKVVADRLDTAMEADGVVYRFTSNALEEGPSGAAGSGTNEWPYTLTRSDNGLPISGALIEVFTDSACTNRVASGYTNTFGIATFWLDTGTYYVRRTHSQYSFSNPDTETVP